MVVFALGECLHGAVQAPLVVDLAEPRLLGRYMALSALSWQVGFALGPAVGGFVLAVSPSGVWVGAAALCALGGRSRSWSRARSRLAARRTPVAVADVAWICPPGAGTRETGYAGSGATITNMALTLDDPLSTHAEPAPHPAHPHGPRHGPGRRTPGAARPRALR